MAGGPNPSVSDKPEGLVYEKYHLNAVALGGGFETAYDFS